MKIDFYPRKAEIMVIILRNNPLGSERYRVFNKSDIRQNIRLSNNQLEFILGFFIGKPDDFGISQYQATDELIFTKLADARINKKSCTIQMEISEFIILCNFLKKHMPMHRIIGVF